MSYPLNSISMNGRTKHSLCNNYTIPYISPYAILVLSVCNFLMLSLVEDTVTCNLLGSSLCSNLGILHHTLYCHTPKWVIMVTWISVSFCCSVITLSTCLPITTFKLKNRWDFKMCIFQCKWTKFLSFETNSTLVNKVHKMTSKLY